MQGQPVIVHSVSLGPYVGVLQSRDGTVVTLGPCRTLIQWRKGDSYLDIARDGLGQREVSVSHQIDGPVLLADVTLIAPLSDKAVKSFVRASEDNLSLVQ